MINRYEVPAVSKIWKEEEKWKRFLLVEMALLETLEEVGRIPKGTSLAFQNVKILPDRIAEIEKSTRHDVVAFCTSITEQVNEEASRFFHFGVTSSDIIDTALMLQVRDSLELVIHSLRTLIHKVDEKMSSTRTLLTLGRSHGMAAEPMVFASKFLSSREELKRRLGDFEQALKTEINGQISGAVGNYSILTPEIEALTLSKLKLNPEPISSQVIPRDHLAKIISIGAMTATAIERLAIEIRHLHRSEVGEVSEGFGKGQAGSSTMPHKKNPVSSENISGLARVIRSHESIALEDILLWHERDISHSSAERLFLPDHFGILVYLMDRMSKTLGDLEIHEEIIEARVKANHRIFSSMVLHSLIEQNPKSREALYSIVQAAALNSDSLEDFISKIKRDCDQAKIKSDLKAFSFEEMKVHYLHQFETVLSRAGGIS